MVELEWEGIREGSEVGKIEVTDLFLRSLNLDDVDDVEEEIVSSWVKLVFSGPMFKL